jgi:nucleoside 2-deoxyribosyltransferase
VVEFANELENLGFDPFADWKTPGPDADDFLRDFYKARGRNYKQTLQSYAARHIYEFDKHHLDRCDAAVMLMPCGKSGHLELGYTIGRGKPGYILFDQEPERVDVMYGFATDVFFNREELFEALKNYGSSQSEQRSWYQNSWHNHKTGDEARACGCGGWV